MRGIDRANPASHSRYVLHVHAGAGGDTLSIRVDDTARNAVLFDWRGTEARCLLESHDVLRRFAGAPEAPRWNIPLSRTSVWHLALHAAAIRCMLNRCAERDRVPGDVQAGAIEAPRRLDSLHLRILRLLRSVDEPLLSSRDVACLLALDGCEVELRSVELAVNELARWGEVRYAALDSDDVLFRSRIGGTPRKTATPTCARGMATEALTPRTPR